MKTEEIRAKLIELAKSKANGRFQSNATHGASIRNPLCGDRVEIRLSTSTETSFGHGLESRKVGAASYAAQACAICSASAALLCDFLESTLPSVTTLLGLKVEFEAALLLPEGAEWPNSIAAFRVFEHLRVNPSRRGCAVLPWIACVTALNRPLLEPNPVETEKQAQSIAER